MKVLCIGHLTYDILISSDSYPLENTKNRVNKVIECGGGQVGNAAYLLGKWGVDTHILGLVGNDEYGSQIKSELESVNVNTNGLQMHDKTTISYIIVNNKNGSRTIFTYHPNDLVMKDEMDDINPDIILMDGYEYEMAIKVIKRYPNAIKVLDAEKNNEQIISLAKMVDYVICSKSFLEKYNNTLINNDKELFRCYEVANHNFKNLIVTLESRGCIYNGKIIKTISVNEVDSTGAGDIFHGAFVYGLTKGWNIDKILAFANIAGSLSVTKLGSKNSVFDKRRVAEVANEFIGSNIY